MPVHPRSNRRSALAASHIIRQEKVNEREKEKEKEKLVTEKERKREREKEKLAKQSKRRGEEFE